MNNFIHLHTHSYGSFQDSCQSPKQIVEKAVKLGMESVAITDHGRCGELLTLKKECEKAKIKPIYGCEFYVAPKERTLKERLEEYKKTSYHLTVLAKNETGLKNIFTLCSLGWTEGFYYKPRIDLELLKKHSEGLVVLSGCFAGRVSQLIIEEEYKQAVNYLIELRDIWKDDFYIEVQNHGMDWQLPLKVSLFTLAEKYSIPIVATQDSHYLDQKDSDLHKYLVKLTAADLEFGTDQLYFKDYKEMLTMFNREEHHAIDRTVEVAHKCVTNWRIGQTIWPIYELPKGITPEQELKDATYKGLNKFFREPTNEYRDRIEHELDVIGRMGFATYFLVVADFINWAKTQEILVGPGRGSAAGSLVCYCLNITEVDPIEYGLFFERFLNSSRISLPDIDLDIAPEERKLILEYIREKYGEEKVAQIGTTSAFKPRGALRAFSRVCGYLPNVGHQLAELIPSSIAGKPLTFSEAIEMEPKLLKTEWPEVVDLARRAEGVKNLAGVHAAGVVISNIDLKTQLPLFLGKSDEIATQFDMHDIEDIGLVKFDLLALKNLSIIKNTLSLIKRDYKKKINLREIDYKDTHVYDSIFKTGNLDGIFQFENSSGFKDLCIQVLPTSIYDLSVITSLFRPGPLSTGQVSDYIAGRRGKEVKYSISKLKPILKETHGVMVFQEQIMKICTDLAEYTLPEADNMRKIMGKKIPEKMKLEREKLTQGCIKNNIDKTKAEELFNNIEGFAQYSFNAAHSIAYSFISYQTAWLKTYYPAEFYTSLLNNAIEKNQDAVIKYIHSAKDNEIPISPPDINRSGIFFELDQGTIIFGFAGIKGLGPKASQSLIEKRPLEGFKSLKELIELKISPSHIQYLAECGALEELTELTHSQLINNLSDILNHYKKLLAWEARIERIATREEERREAAKEGKKIPRKLPKLKEKPELKEIEEREPLSRAERLRLERKTLGFYLTGHPLDDYPGIVRMAKYSISDIKEGKTQNREKIKIPIVLSSVTIKTTKKKQAMGTITIEDKTGRIEAIVFPRQWKKLKDLMLEETVNIISGSIEKIEADNEDSPSVIKMTINNIKPILEDIKIEIKKLTYMTVSNAKIEFLPKENTTMHTWQQASSYIKNLQKMGD